MPEKWKVVQHILTEKYTQNIFFHTVPAAKMRKRLSPKGDEALRGYLRRKLIHYHGLIVIYRAVGVFQHNFLDLCLSSEDTFTVIVYLFIPI
jgi:hypothetical protein